MFKKYVAYIGLIVMSLYPILERFLQKAMYETARRTYDTSLMRSYAWFYILLVAAGAVILAIYARCVYHLSLQVLVCIINVFAFLAASNGFTSLSYVNVFLAVFILWNMIARYQEMI